MEELKKELLKKLKTQKDIDVSQTDRDDVFLFALETAIFEILSYCNLEFDEWPEMLNNTAVLMAIDYLNEAAIVNTATESDGEVKSLTEGDFSISKETRAEVFQKMQQSAGFARNYLRILNRYRKLAR